MRTPCSMVPKLFTVTSSTKSLMHNHGHLWYKPQETLATAVIVIIAIRIIISSSSWLHPHPHNATVNNQSKHHSLASKPSLTIIGYSHQGHHQSCIKPWSSPATASQNDPAKWNHQTSIVLYLMPHIATLHIPYMVIFVAIILVEFWKQLLLSRASRLLHSSLSNSKDVARSVCNQMFWLVPPSSNTFVRNTQRLFLCA